MEKTQYAEMKQALKIYQDGMGLINYLAFLVFLFLLPMPWHWVQPVWVVWLIAWFLEGRWLKRDNFGFSKKLIPQLLILAFVAWEALSLIWTDNLQMGQRDLSKHIYFVAVLIVSLFGVNERYDTGAMKTAVCLGSVVAVIGYSMISMWLMSDGIRELWPNVTDIFPQFGQFDYVGGEHINFIKHHLYMALVILAAICFSPDIYKTFKGVMRKEYAIAGIVVCDLILCYGIIASTCRIAMFLLPVMFVICMLVYYDGKYRKGIMVGSLVIAVILIGTLLVRSERLRTSFDDIHLDYNEQRQAYIEAYDNARPYIWYTVIKHVGDYGVTGKGLGSEEDTMNKYYEEDGQHLCRLMSFNAHSTYLSTWIQLGPIAMVLLISILVVMPFCYPIEQRKRVAMICLLIAAVMLTETILWRMSGLYIIFALMILSKPYKEHE